MKHALSTRCIASHRLTTSWLEKIWDAEIPAVELFYSRQHLDYRDSAHIADLGHWFRDSPLKVCSVQSPTSTGPAMPVSITETVKAKRIQAVDEIKRALDIVEVMPFDYFVQHIGVEADDFDQHKLDAAFTSLDELGIFARQRGVELLLENGLNALSSGERLEYFNRITHLNIKYCFDTGNAHHGIGVEQELDIMKSRIRLVHVHDNNGKARFTGREAAHDLPFTGTIQWRKTMHLLRNSVPDSTLVMELAEKLDVEKPLDNVRRAFERLENLKPIDDQEEEHEH